MTSYARKSSALLGITTVATALLAPSLAQAHPAAGPAAGLGFGFAHPFVGLDHLAAMVGVGWWAAQRGGRAWWILPLSFLGVMAFGGFLGATGVALPFVEPALAASVLVLGILIASAVRMRLLASGLLVGVCALFHGHAHGSELPATLSGLAYGAGFLAATTLLHGAGLGLGLLARVTGSARLVRYAGGATAVIGFWLLMI